MKDAQYDHVIKTATQILNRQNRIENMGIEDAMVALENKPVLESEIKRLGRVIEAMQITIHDHQETINDLEEHRDMLRNEISRHKIWVNESTALLRKVMEKFNVRY